MIDGIYIRVAIAALLIGVGTFGGCRWQGAIDRGEIADRDAAIVKKNTALLAASEALRGNAVRFREIDALTGINAEAAAHAKARAELEASSARRDADLAKGRLSRLEAELIREQTSCVDGRRPICGIPLR